MDMQQQPTNQHNAGYDQPAAPQNVNVTVNQPQQGYPPAYPAVPQQGNTTVVMMNQPTPIQSFVGHIVFSCVVFWCCGWIFGIIAFIFALVGQDRANTGDQQGARAMGRASYGVSIAGLVIGIILLIVIIVYYTVLVNQVVQDAINNPDTDFSNSDYWGNK